MSEPRQPRASAEREGPLTARGQPSTPPPGSCSKAAAKPTRAPTAAAMDAPTPTAAPGWYEVVVAPWPVAFAATMRANATTTAEPAVVRAAATRNHRGQRQCVTTTTSAITND